MRFLFTTLQHVESDFYGRVGRELMRCGDEVVHVTWSRRAARCLCDGGTEAYCLPDLMATLDPHVDVDAEARRIEADYGLPSMRDVYATDWACDGRDERWCVRRTVRHFLALERLIQDADPDVVVPEVGSETMRTAAHLAGLRRRIPVLFLFYTIFPDPLRLYVDSMDGPIVGPEDLRELTPAEREAVDEFVASFTADGRPIRDYRETGLSGHRLQALARHLAVKAVWDQDNDYLRPVRWARSQLAEQVRFRMARALYGPIPAPRPFYYFPLHVVDDYKIERVVPHCADQASLIEQVARFLPEGVQLVIKEHPMSIGRNPLSMLRRVSRGANVTLVGPYESSHELIRRSAGVVVIGSTVGLEALLYRKPVLTLGRPFYAGLGLTLDADPGPELCRAVPRLRGFRPDEERIMRFLHAAMQRCVPGAPALVDRSEGNAARLASTLHHEASKELERRAGYRGLAKLMDVLHN